MKNLVFSNFSRKTSEKIWKNFGKGLEKIRIFSNKVDFFPTFSDVFPPFPTTDNNFENRDIFPNHAGS